MTFQSYPKFVLNSFSFTAGVKTAKWHTRDKKKTETCMLLCLLKEEEKSSWYDDTFIRDSWETDLCEIFFFFFFLLNTEQFVGCQRSVISHNRCDTPGRLMSGSAGLNDWIHVKHVLNWAYVCSPNILQTVQRTTIRFLIKLLVHQTWFRQFDELYLILSWLVMRYKLRPELAADVQQTAWSKI